MFTVLCGMWPIIWQSSFLIFQQPWSAETLEYHMCIPGCARFVQILYMRMKDVAHIWNIKSVYLINQQQCRAIQTEKLWWLVKLLRHSETVYFLVHTYVKALHSLVDFDITAADVLHHSLLLDQWFRTLALYCVLHCALTHQTGYFIRT